MIGYVILWYITGVIFSVLTVMEHDEELTIRDLVLNFTAGGICGPTFILIYLMTCISKNVNFRKVLWKKGGIK
jgi:hypothetical protein